MDEHEVELIEYFRVMWWGKWLILGCFAVAVGLSALILWTRPDVHEEAVSYRLYQSFETYGMGGFNPALVVHILEDFTEAFEGGPEPEAEVQNDLVIVTVSSSADDKTRTAVFDASLGFVEGRLLVEALNRVQERMANLEISLAQVGRKATLLTERIAELGSPSLEDPLLDALTEQLASVEAHIAQERSTLETLSSVEPTELFRLEEVARSPVSLVPVNQKATLAVAGFLGLFLGVLLAFFVHYLVTVREREQAKRVDQKAH